MSHQANGSFLVTLFPLLVLVVFVLIGVTYMKRKGYARGGGDNVVVRCGAGHLFTTIWIPLVSLKAIRLGPFRYQYCPVGRHWALVDVVDVSQLTAAEKQFAADHHDSRIP